MLLCWEVGMRVSCPSFQHVIVHSVHSLHYKCTLLSLLCPRSVTTEALISLRRTEKIGKDDVGCAVFWMLQSRNSENTPTPHSHTFMSLHLTGCPSPPSRTASPVHARIVYLLSTDV